MSFSTLTSQDLGWHLKTGEWIVKNLQIPHYDFYTSPAPKNLWIDLHWGFQAFIYTIGSIGGLLGLNLFRSFLLLLIYFFVYKASQRKENPWFISSIALLSILCAQERFQMRPELLTFLFMTLYLTILESQRDKESKWLWAIPIIQIFWTNVEGLFMIGPALVFFYALGNLWEGEGKNSWKLWIVFIVTLLACFINPYGLEGFLFPFTLLKEILFKGTNPFMGVGEFHPPTELPVTKIPTQAFLLLFGLTVFTCITKIKQINRTHIILFIVFASLAFVAQRNLGLFSFFGLFIILKYAHFPKLFSKKIFSKIGIFIYFLFSSTLVFSTVSNHFYVRDLRPERFGLGISPEIFPPQAISYFRQNQIKGRIFGSIDLAPTIIYCLWPNLQPFIDTRLELHGPERFREYQQALGQESKWKQFQQKYNIQMVFADHIQKDSLRLISFLAHDSNWKLVYFDEISVIFLKQEISKDLALTNGCGNIPSPVSFYPKLRECFPWLIPEATLPNEINMSRLYLALGENKEAKLQYLKLLKVLPKWTEGWINLAYFSEKEGKISKAISLLEQALYYNPRSYQAHFNMGNLFLKTGRYQDAFKALDKAIQIKKTPQAIHNREIAKKFDQEQKRNIQTKAIEN